jgi:methionyl-tRNA synthetase
MAEKFYVTTAIDYVNAAPHIGHAYQKIIADVLARWNKLIGKEVLFVTGTDEHGKKVQESAEKADIPVKEFVDSIVVKFKDAWKSLNIDYDRFIRTTDSDHKKVVEEIILKCNDKGEIYKDKYAGLYCTGCEQFYTEKELEDNICPMHNRPLEKIEEESYFFKLSNYTEELLKLYKKHPEFILPQTRRNEIINRVKEGLRDLSITRTSFDWGIPFPLDKTHVTYVWFDALINYYTATREKDREDFWGKPTVHLLGKDNTWFHTVYWPAMLKSAGIDLPKTTVNHGFLTFNGQKISKSLGNSISPQVLVEKYGCDSIRYFVCRHFPFASGEDGDFSEDALVERHNGELSNKLGNLVSRVSGLIEKNGMEESVRTLDVDFDKINSLMENFEVDKALNEIFAFIDRCNEHVQNEKPWETKDKKVLYELAEAIKKISILLYPFIPETCEKISEKFGGYEFTIDEFEKPLVEVDVVKGENLFSRIETKDTSSSTHKGVPSKLGTKVPSTPVKPNLKKENEPKEIMENVTTIQFDDFAKIELKVAQIRQVEEIPKADKLYKLTLDDGSTDGRTICAGIKEFYKMDELKDKKIIIVANLAPRKLRGIESCGMLLAASNADHTVVSLISPDKDIEPGSLVG